MERATWSAVYGGELTFTADQKIGTHLIPEKRETTTKEGEFKERQKVKKLGEPASLLKEA